MKIFIFLIFPIILFANYSKKSEVENCISKSVGRLRAPDDVSMTVSSSCLEAPCFAIPEGFSCIYYKISGDILEEDAAKKLVYENQLKDAQIIKDDFDDAQTVDAINNYCQYMFDSGCKALPAADKTKAKTAVMIQYTNIKPAILLKLGL